MLCSDAARTAQTWALVAAAFDAPLPLQYLSALYHATPATMQTLIAVADVDTLALVAHNPGIGELATALGVSDHPRFADFPTGATAVFDLGGPKPRLAAFTTPHDLP